MHKGNYLKEYIKEMTHIMLEIHPEWDEEEIKKGVKDAIDTYCTNPAVTLDNNYTGESKDASLLSVLDWVLERKPIIAGNGTFYKNQEEAMNPIANMLKGFLTQRKEYKKQMFAVEDTSSPEYKDLDLAQQNEKVLANSYYGGSGMKQSAFYSQWSGPATTGGAQSVISTAEQMFEGMVADNYLFLNATEALEFCECILRDFDFSEFDSFIQTKDPMEVAARYFDAIISHEDNDLDILKMYMENQTDEELSVLYYTNNIREFISDHQEISDIILSIFENVENLDYVDENDEMWLKDIPKVYYKEFVGKTQKDWNNFVNQEYFMNPNNPPSSVKEQLVLLKEYMVKYVYARYLSFDRIYRLKNLTRYTVTVIDTDSNILSLDTLVNQIQEDIICGQTFGRSDMYNDFIAVNMIAYVLSAAVEDVLLYYGKQANIPEEYRPIFSMKNEFFFSRLVIGSAKKRYISRIVLREGNLMHPPKLDIKGFDFKKSTTSEYAEKVFMKIIKKHILESDEIDVRAILVDVEKFKKKIRESIASGDTFYLPNGSAKAYEAYAKPESQQALKGAIAWNYLMPDETIEFPSKVSILKLNIFDIKDIAPLKETHPDLYTIMDNRIFHDETGMFVKRTWEIDEIKPIMHDGEWWKEIPKKYRTKYKKLGREEWNIFAKQWLIDNRGMECDEGHYEYNISGLQSIAIPQGSEIPQWIQPYIDFDTMINNILAPFIPLIEALGVRTIETGRTRNGTNRKTSAITNIVKF